MIAQQVPNLVGIPSIGILSGVNVSHTLLKQHRLFFDGIAEIFDVRSCDDWGNISHVDISSRGGDIILSSHENSLSVALNAVYPHTTWHPWIFEHQSIDFWAKTDNQRRFMDWLSYKLSVDKPIEWMHVKSQHILDFGGEILLSIHGGCIRRLLQTVYPDVDWHVWLFGPTPTGFWNVYKNQRAYFDWLADELQLSSVDDWYSVRHSDFVERGGSGFLTLFCKGSYSKGLQMVYKHTRWQLWRFDKPPANAWADMDIQRDFFEQLADELNVYDYSEEYNRISAREVEVFGGRGLLAYYNDNLLLALRTAFPKLSWKPWQAVDKLKRTFWHDVEVQKQFVRWLQKKLNIRELDDWYTVSKENILELGGSGLLAHYQDSFMKVLEVVYPHHDWHPWIFNRDMWYNYVNQRRYFDWLAEKLYIHVVEDWYKVSKDDVARRGGGSLLLNYYQNSLIKALEGVHPRTEWHLWRFQNVSKAYWHNMETQREYFDWLCDQFEIVEMEQWYDVKRVQKVEELDRHIGLIRNHYNNSYFRALTNIYPEVKWHPWLYDSNATTFWEQMENQRMCFDWIAEQLNINKLERWYRVRLGALQARGVEQLMQFQYDNTVSNALQSVYPDTEWHMWRFEPSPKGFWKQDKNVWEYLKWLEQRLQVDDVKDWHGISNEQIVAHDGGRLLKYACGNMMKLLKQFYPHHNWNSMEWRPSTITKAQVVLYDHIKALVDSEHEVEFNYPFTLSKPFEGTDKTMEIDIWIPKYNIAIEYQGQHHYVPNEFISEYSAQVSKDLEKKKSCIQAGIIFIYIPFWWDYQEGSLAATIWKYCPEAIEDVFAAKDSTAIPNSTVHSPGKILTLKDTFELQ